MEEIRKFIQSQVEIDLGIKDLDLKNLPKTKPWGFSSTIAFRQRLNAEEIAEKINGLDLKPFVKEVVEENGYINIYLDEIFMSRLVISSILGTCNEN